MDSSRPFSIEYVTYDKKKGAGGVWKSVLVAYKRLPGNKYSEPKQMKRNPNNFQNSTVTIRIPGDQDIQKRTVHYQLIRRFNGAIVK